VLLRLVLTLVTMILLCGLVRSGTASVHGERPAHGLASTDAAGAPDPTPELDTGGEATLPAAEAFALPHADTRAVTGPPPPVFVGRLHAVRLFRPPRFAPLA
jgi:hypothetical protein